MGSMDVIERLQNGDISVERAVCLLKNGDRKTTWGPGRFIKINITGDGKKIKLIFPIFLINAGISFTRFIIKSIPETYQDDKTTEALEVFKQLDSQDIKTLADSFRMCKGMNFIEVHNNDGDVSIRVI